MSGRENLKNLRPCLVVANHLSYNDPPLIGSILGVEVSYLAKKELFRSKVIGSFLRYYNAIPINRTVFDRAGLANVMDMLKKGNYILLFPEGSRKSFTAKPGTGFIIYETGVPVLPVYLENTNRFWDCLLRRKRVRIVIGEMFYTSHYQDKPADKKIYRQISEEILAKVYALKPAEDI